MRPWTAVPPQDGRRFVITGANGGLGLQTARILDCTVGTVKSQVSKAFAKLRIDPALLDSTSTDQEVSR